MYIGVAIVIILVVAVLLITSAAPKKQATLASYDNMPVPRGLISKLNVPNRVNNAVGLGSVQTYVKPIKNASTLTLNGKPEILYIGAEYCPFCAAERWALVIALMRFGNFSSLHLMTSDPDPAEYSPSTPTFTFYNSTYSSPYISFVSVEEATNNKTNLQAPTAAEAALFAKYDPQGGIPFILFANKSLQLSSNFDPESVLYGRNWSDIATALQNSSTLQSQAIIGTANLLTEQICEADNFTPQSVCSQHYVTAIRQAVG